MKENWLSAHVEVGHAKFRSSKKRLANGKDLNTLIVSNME